MRRVAVLLAGLPLLIAGSARAQAPSVDVCGPPPPADSAAPFASNTNHVGVIDLFYFLAQDQPVTFYECDGDRATELGVRSVPGSPTTGLVAATTWSCTKTVRRFAAVATLPDGTVSRGQTNIRTPSCAHRFALSAPTRAKRGRGVAVRVRDSWGIGDYTAKLCVTAPGRRRACTSLHFAKAAATATRHLDTPRTGAYRVTVEAGRFRVAKTVAVGVRAPKVVHQPLVLATGDSTMGGVASFLDDDLESRADVLQDVQPGYGISNNDDGWQPIAVPQVARHHPAVTVVSIGAAEGFPMKTRGGDKLDCCGADWIAEYARRVRAAMTTYLQHGRGKVVFATVVAPRDPARAPIVAAVNQAIDQAAQGLTGVTVAHEDQVFSPMGYQETIRYRGQDVAVREPDGVHLNVSGTSIEAADLAAIVKPLLTKKAG